MSRQHTPGALQLWTSNSFRRFYTSEGNPVCEPITQNDGHPDLYFRNGGPDGPDARRIVQCWNEHDSLLAERDRLRAENDALRSALMQIHTTCAGNLMMINIGESK